MTLAPRRLRPALARFALASALVVAPLVPAHAPVSAQGTDPAAADAVSVIYLVRHGETADDDPRDPSLSSEGFDRATELVRVLADVPLSNVFSTPYRRTLGTARPVASAHGLEIVEYDPGSREAMETFVRTLASTPGHHLVSGHSNTTPAVVEALGGDPGTEIDHAEYDRLYIVTVHPDGSVTTSLLHYGAPFQGAHAPAR